MRPVRPWSPRYTRATLRGTLQAMEDEAEQDLEEYWRENVPGSCTPRWQDLLATILVVCMYIFSIGAFIVGASQIWGGR